MKYFICIHLSLQNYEKKKKLLQSGNLCLQNSIKVEMLELILKDRSWKNLNNDASCTLLYYTIILLYNIYYTITCILLLYNSCSIILYTHHYKTMRTVFKNIEASNYSTNYFSSLDNL